VGAGAANLVLRAARLLRLAAGERGGAEIVLVKRVPAGSGLGGGSSDAAAALRLLARLWGLRADREALRHLAAQMGSDCAFFVGGGRARATGRGEKLRPARVPELRRLLLALPAEGVPTPLAYRLLDRSRRNASHSNELTPSGRDRSISQSQTLSTMGWGYRSLLRNDFEEVIASHYPGVRAATSMLIELGGGIPRLSGSGSAVFSVLPPRKRTPGVVTRLRRRSLAVLLARFTRVGSLWCR
jgi:4-diphosphocytidyl-2-C-methyl-D-erythritol kinase